MSIDKAIHSYALAVKDAEKIIQSHLNKAFIELNNKHGATPVSVEVQIERVQAISDPMASGVIIGCRVEFDR